MTINNIWLINNEKKVHNLLTELTNYHMKGSYGGDINLLDVINIIESSKQEIVRLASENNALRNLISNAKKETILK